MKKPRILGQLEVVKDGAGYFGYVVWAFGPPPRGRLMAGPGGRYFKTAALARRACEEHICAAWKNKWLIRWREALPGTYWKAEISQLPRAATDHERHLRRLTAAERRRLSLTDEEAWQSSYGGEWVPVEPSVEQEAKERGTSVKQGETGEEGS